MLTRSHGGDRRRRQKEATEGGVQSPDSLRSLRSPLSAPSALFDISDLLPLSHMLGCAHCRRRTSTAAAPRPHSHPPPGINRALYQYYAVIPTLATLMTCSLMRSLKIRWRPEIRWKHPQPGGACIVLVIIYKGCGLNLYPRRGSSSEPSMAVGAPGRSLGRSRGAPGGGAPGAL